MEITRVPVVAGRLLDKNLYSYFYSFESGKPGFRMRLWYLYYLHIQAKNHDLGSKIVTLG